jgi:hypothetical protein
MIKAGLSKKLDGIFEFESAKFYLILFGILFTITAVPIFIVKIPAMGDYLNHLARMHVIASVDSDPLLARYYEIKWNLIPNIGMDLVVPLLSRFFDIYLAGKIFVLIVLVLITSGVFAIHYVVYKQFSLAPFVALLFIYNTVFLFGFMNYLFGLGLAFWAIAIWIKFREYHPFYKALIALISVFILFVCHLYAVSLFVFAIGCFELWRLRQKGINNRRSFITFALILTVPCILVIALLLNSPTLEGISNFKWAPLWRKFNAIEWLIGLYHYHQDRLIGAGLAALSIFALGKGLLRIHPVGWLIMIFGVILYVVMPNWLFGSWAADHRLPSAILFMIIGFTHWKLPNAYSRVIFVGAVFVIILIRVTQVGAAWTMYDQVYAEMRKGFTIIEPGSILIKVVAKHPPPRPYAKASPLNHTPSLAVIDRSIYTPHLFKGGRSFVLRIKPEYKQLNYLGRSNLRLSRLVEAEENPDLNPGTRKHRLLWKKHIDYVLVLYTSEKDPNPLPNILELKYQGKAFRIYKLMKPSI